MAFRKSLPRWVLNLTQSNGYSASRALPPNPLRKLWLPPDSEERGFFRWLFQKRDSFHSAPMHVRRMLPSGEELTEQIRALNGERLRLEGLMPLPPARPDDVKITTEELGGLEMQMLKETIGSIDKNRISYTELIQICRDCARGSKSDDEIRSIVRMLNESGVVFAIGNAVFLRPEEVVKIVDNLIPPPETDPRRQELVELKKQKQEIDEQAKALVQRELQLGLGLFMAHTIGFMRLTFWELSWDVMEPICYFVASSYFTVKYVFFLKTSTEPSFRGFFKARFAAKQRQLMQARNFDAQRFKDLRRAFHLSDSS